MKKPENQGGRQSPPDGHGIVTADGRPFDVPEKGSIALLALGYRGLMAWRAKRIETARNKPQPPSAP